MLSSYKRQHIRGFYVNVEEVFLCISEMEATLCAGNAVISFPLGAHGCPTREKICGIFVALSMFGKVHGLLYRNLTFLKHTDSCKQAHITISVLAKGFVFDGLLHSRIHHHL